MQADKESFLKSVKSCADESEVDQVCFDWLKLLCADHGVDGTRAVILLDLVKDILEA